MRRSPCQVTYLSRLRCVFLRRQTRRNRRRDRIQPHLLIQTLRFAAKRNLHKHSLGLKEDVLVLVLWAGRKPEPRPSGNTWPLWLVGRPEIHAVGHFRAFRAELLALPGEGFLAAASVLACNKHPANAPFS